MEAFSIKYKIRDPSNGDLLFAGNTKECAEFMGITMKTFQNGTHYMLRRNKEIYRGYHIEVEKAEKVEKVECNSKPFRNDVTKQQAKAWDDFVMPIRERYGIPVYRSIGGVEKDA